MKFAVFGTGAVGGYFGARLAQAGHEVGFITRPKYLETLVQNGLSIQSIDGDFLLHPLRVTDDPAALGPVDCVLVAVKAWQVEDAARAIKPLIGAHTRVLPLQNGVEAPRQLREVLGEKPVLGGLCKIICKVVRPGHLQHSGAEPYIALGEWDNSRGPSVDSLSTCLSGAGIRCEIPPNIQVAMWQKFLFIAAFSGVGAVTRAPIGVIRSLPQTRTMLVEAMAEIDALARVQGLDLGPDIVEKTMAFVDGLPAHATASMQRDMMEGRPSELEYQTGSVVRLSRLHQCPCPLNTFIYQALVPQEQEAGKNTGNP